METLRKAKKKKKKKKSHYFQNRQSMKGKHLSCRGRHIRYAFRQRKRFFLSGIYTEARVSCMRVFGTGNRINMPSSNSSRVRCVYFRTKETLGKLFFPKFRMKFMNFLLGWCIIVKRIFRRVIC